MTVYLNFRAGAVGGGVIDPYVLRGDGTVKPVALATVDWPLVGALVTGRNVVFGVHGFNVNYAAGADTLGQLDKYFAFGNTEVFVGVLWPGDSWIPVVDYPFEGNAAMKCGQLLAAFCARWFAQAQSLSFVSHSLGARLVLEAVERLERRVRVVCLTAGAVNRDCLVAEYADAAANANAISLLASHRDFVLKLAYPIGDPIADLLHDDHTPFQPALGYGGPTPPTPPVVHLPWQIPDGNDYGHLDYMPPSGAAQNPPTPPKWMQVADFMKRAVQGASQTWP